MHAARLMKRIFATVQLWQLITHNCSSKIIVLVRACSFFFVIWISSALFSFVRECEKGSSRFKKIFPSYLTYKCIKRINENNCDVHFANRERWIFVLFLHQQRRSDMYTRWWISTMSCTSTAKGTKVYLSKNHGSTATVSVVLTGSKILFQCQHTLFSLIIYRAIILRYITFIYTMNTLSDNN